MDAVHEANYVIECQVSEANKLCHHRGLQIANDILAVAELGENVWKEYPFLYEGTLQDHIEYLQSRYLQEESQFFLLYQGEKAIAALLCTSLASAPEYYRMNIPKSASVEHILYVGELMVDPNLRNMGLARCVLDFASKKIDTTGYEGVCFCDLVREPSDRLYQYSETASKEENFRALGFERKPEWDFLGKWRVLGEEEESTHPLQYWYGDINNVIELFSNKR